MAQQALGLIETIGYATAVSAADAALKAANVRLEAVERVIGVGGMLGVTVHFAGDVAAVQSAVEAGKLEASRVGTLVSAHVLPRAHQEVALKVLSRFEAAKTLPTEEGGPTLEAATDRDGSAVSGTEKADGKSKMTEENGQERPTLEKKQRPNPLKPPAEDT
ncbi:BMC domain-containing protein [Cohnella sp. AR92]|uniref:BMC domain-containing protein n=1 Tax=Cohnella sp. AR92 TaxID=648716 RepID=UPI000F8D5D3A|nr:BMC domain-containing protein [Cohnella sp. AR92]RUS47072.1 BMC domain-containing protein [Cohnella sp. AR92]